MGKFCRFCGKQLSEGQLCDCKDAQMQAGMPSIPDTSLPNEGALPSDSSSVQQSYESSTQSGQGMAPTGSSYNAASAQAGQYQQGMPQAGQANHAVPPQAGQYQGMPQAGQPYPFAPNGQGYNHQWQQGNPYGNVQPGVRSAAISHSFGNVFQLFKAFVLNPFETMKTAFETPNKTDQFLAGGVFMVIIWLISFLMLKNPLMKSSSLLGKTFLFVLFYVFVRFLYIVGIYLFTKNKNPRVSVSSLCGLLGISLILDSFLFLVLLLFRLLALFEFMPLALIVLFITTVISSVAITNVATEGNFAQSFKISLILQSIIVVVISILLSVIVRKILMGAVQNEIMSELGGLGDLGNLMDGLF